MDTVNPHKEEPSGLRTSWQKFDTLIPKNTRTCYTAKSDQVGLIQCFMWVAVKL